MRLSAAIHNRVIHKLLGLCEACKKYPKSFCKVRGMLFQAMLSCFVWIEIE